MHQVWLVVIVYLMVGICIRVAGVQGLLVIIVAGCNTTESRAVVDLARILQAELAVQVSVRLLI